MKKLLFVALFVFFCAALISCSNSKMPTVDAEITSTAQNAATTTTIRITQIESTIDYGPPVITPPEEIVQIEENDIQAALPYERQYRFLYYITIPLTPPK